jgi:hypothetical protein
VGCPRIRRPNSAPACLSRVRRPEEKPETFRRQVYGSRNDTIYFNARRARPKASGGCPYRLAGIRRLASDVVKSCEIERELRRVGVNSGVGSGVGWFYAGARVAARVCATLSPQTRINIGRFRNPARKCVWVR